MIKSFEIAKHHADAVDSQIRECILNKKSFIVEAAAGSGKTYSLNSTVDWLETTKPLGLNVPGKKIACITFTNVAVDVMKSRLPDDSNVEPSTIHTFCWNLIKNFQESLIEHIKDAVKSKRKDYSSFDVKKITYDLGVRRYDKESCSLSLYHDDVINYFLLFLDEPKFRRLLISLYPIILIDEYQDTNKFIVEKFIKYFIDDSDKPKPVLGLFGDAWQCIYGSLSGVGEIQDKGFERISKNVNFRSKSNIVNMLNKIRPDAQQICAKEDDYDKGNVCLLTCKDLDASCFDEKTQDLVPEKLREIIDLVVQKISNLTFDKTKVLMITHRTVSKSLNFEQFLEVYGTDIFRDQDDPFFKYSKEIIEPIFNALEKDDPLRLADALGIENMLVNKKIDKKNWKNIYASLKEKRSGSLYDVIEYCIKNDYGLIPQNDDVDFLFNCFKEDEDYSYNNKSVGSILKLSYLEFLNAFEYIDEKTIFSTEHASKGDEFDNVIFVINKGWNLYNYHKYFPFNINNNDPSFKRNRNLFYVSCSRAVKRLFFLLTYTDKPEFENYLDELASHNKFTINDFLSIYSLK